MGFARYSTIIETNDNQCFHVIAKNFAAMSFPLIDMTSPLATRRANLQTGVFKSTFISIASKMRCESEITETKDGMYRSQIMKFIDVS